MADFDFFVSYASPDIGWARWLTWELESEGFRVFLDRSFHEPGDSWTGLISDAISKSNNLIALLSSSYLQSDYPQSEWFSVFLTGPVAGPRLLPIRIENVKPPPLFSTIGSLDIFGLSPEEASARLRSALSQLPVDRQQPSFPDSVTATPARQQPKAIRIFISYSHRDVVWLNRVRTFLKPFERKGTIDIWSDTRIEAGELWRAEIAQALENADIAILLVSSDFLASDFIHNEELPRILAKAEEGSTKVYSLIVRPSRYLRSSLAQFQSFNPPSEPLSKLKVNDREELLVRFVDFIEDSL